MKKVRLISDFRDFYDHWFDGADAELTFHRLSASGMPRREMLEYLQALGLRVPAFGQVADVYKKMRQRYEFLDLNGFVERFGMVVLVVEYIPATPSGLGASWRYLQIGDKIFWLEYFSRDDWRSNCGDVEVHTLAQMEDGYHKHIKHPLFAVDFVWGDTLYAIDFNIAPGVAGTGVENILPAKQAADAIKTAVALFRESGAAEESGSQDVADVGQSV